MYLIGRVFWTDSASDFLIGRLILTHQMMSTKVFTAFVILEFYTLRLLDRSLLALSAIANRMTINEYRHIQDYSYLTTVERVKHR